MEILASILIIVSCYVFYEWFNLHKRRSDNLPPSPRGLPIIGNPIVFHYDYKKLTELSKVYGGLYSLSLFGKRFIVLNDWKTIKAALIGQSDIFSGRINLHVTKQINQFNDISTTDGAVYRENKSTTIKLLRKFGLLNQTVESVIHDEITKVMEIIDKNNHEPVQITDYFFMPLLNISWGIVTGKTYKYDDSKLIAMMERIQEYLRGSLTTLPVNVLPWLRFVPFDPFKFHKHMANATAIKTYLKEVIVEHVTALVTESEPRDFIDGYLRETAATKSEQEQVQSLTGITYNLLIAGMDTVKNTLDYSLMYMVHWPEVQRKIQQEVDKVIGRYRIPSYSDISKMPYTEATMLEIHRYVSVVPLSALHRVMQTTTLEGYTIPKDSIVIPNLYAVHYEKTLWGDPETFRPERFIDSDGKVQKPDYLINFGIGGRLCIGIPLTRMELFLFLTCLLQKYSFEKIPGEPLPSFEPEYPQSLVKVPKPFRLIVKQR